MLVWVLLSCCLVRSTIGYNEEDESDIHRFIGDQASKILEYLDDELGSLGNDIEFGKLELYLEESASQEMSPETIDCADCRAVIGILLSVIRNGTEWDDMRDAMVDICYPFVNASGWDGDLMCEGVIDNYGPHAYWIFANTNLTAEEICTKFNQCYEPDGPPVPTLPPGPTGGPPRHNNKQNGKHPKWSKKRRVVNLEEAIKVAHITDIHVDKDYATGAAVDCGLPTCCREDVDGEGSAGYWGDYSCNVPPRTVELFLDFINDVLEPDIIAQTGDNCPHFVWEETQWGQLNVSRYVTDAIAQHVPGVPAYATIGNHEMYPTNLYYIPRPEIQEFNREYAEYWRELSRFESEQIETVEYAGYYSVNADLPDGQGDGLVIISYNSNYGVTDNWYNLINEYSDDYKDMQEFMEDALNDARDNGQKVILLTHHSPGGGGSYINYGQWLTDLLIRYGDVIVLHLAGHNHGDQYKMATDEVDESYNVIFHGAALNTISDINPTVRIYYLDPDTFEPLDYDQYFLDFRPDEKQEEPEIVFVYRASEEYGLADLSPASYKDLTDRFETDQDLFQQYLYNKRTRTRDVGLCTDSCKHNELCGIRSTSYDQYRTCVDNVYK